MYLFERKTSMSGQLPLKGLRVLDLASFIAGAVATPAARSVETSPRHTKRAAKARQLCRSVCRGAGIRVMPQRVAS
jgi:hypothetical protein